MRGWLAAWLVLAAAGCGFNSSGGTTLVDDGADVVPPQGFEFTVSNVDPPAVGDYPAVDIDCGDVTFDSDLGGFSGCTDEGGQVIGDSQAFVVVVARSYRLRSGSRLRLVGARPVVFLVYGGARIEGQLYADSDSMTLEAALRPGAGARPCEDTPTEGQGGVDSGAGGGGGGFGTVGRGGGVGALLSGGAGQGGAIRGSETGVPLEGGCHGRDGGPSLNADGGIGGFGGGALQLSAAGKLEITGNLSASGAGGRGGEDGDGGGGGGSGGAILLEADTVRVTSAADIVANGGGGGEGGSGTANCGDRCDDGADGSDSSSAPAAGGSGATNTGGNGGRGASSTDAALTGGSGSAAGLNAGGGGGGGGGAGRIRINGASGCDLSVSATVSPAASTACGAI